MATLLYAWELGGGLGHVLPFRPVARELIAHGHTIVAALRDQTEAQRAFGDLPLRCLPAPHKNWPTHDRIDPLYSFAHILHNTGWSRAEDLCRLVSAWQALIDDIRPDAIICDHSPALLLALRGNSTRRVAFGFGFCHPPDLANPPILRGPPGTKPDAFARDEEHVLSIANEVLRERGQSPLARLSQLYTDVDEVFLTTFAELDHFAGRKDATYYGTWPTGVGERTAWPDGARPRVFAYLKNGPTVPAIVRHLTTRRLSTIVFAPNLPEAMRQQLTSPSLKFAERPVDIRQMLAECDLAITHGTHGTTAQFLLAGKPLLLLPLYLEQAILAKRCEQQGFGVAEYNGQPVQAVAALEKLLSSERYAQAARRFPAKYQNFDPQNSIATIVKRMDALATGPKRSG